MERGKLLYHQAKITFNFYDEDSDIFYFLVKSNVEPTYEVSLNLADPEWNEDRFANDEFYGEEEIDCTCQYLYENLECKHVAAAILFFEANRGGVFTPKPDEEMALFSGTPAIDRCYRMGQEKHVIGYRMVCTNAIEEKIMRLQQAKTKMAKEVIAEGDSFLGSLDAEGMLALFD